MSCIGTRWIMLAVLLALARQDCREQRIDGRLLLLPALCGSLEDLAVRGQADLLPRICSLLPGILLTLLAFGSGESFGEGDGAMIFCLGFILSPADCILTAAASLGAGGLIGFWHCLAANRWHISGIRTHLQGKRIPLAPSLAAVYAVMLGFTYT